MRKDSRDAVAEGVIRWGPIDRETVAAPAPALELLTRAIAVQPDNPALHARLAGIHIDHFDFAAAAAALETALRLDPAAPRIPERLARCYNGLRRHEDALAVLASDAGTPRFERGVAYLELGSTESAEQEFRAVLDADPGHRHACWKLCKLLRAGGRAAETLVLCEDLHTRGAAHAQLFYDWGLALALTGDEARARALLFDPRRVRALALPVPAGFPDLASFNAALAGEILANPYRLSDFPVDEEANRGSARVHQLLAGRRPELVRLLMESLQTLVASSPTPMVGDFDPWARARPRAAHLKAWGLIQRGGDHEAWHTHRGGWLSGVYYVRVPKSVSARGAGRGCIEFGPPPALAKAKPGFIPNWRHAPKPGTLLLAPSHFPHRTIPTGAREHRLSIAFDVVPDA